MLCGIETGDVSFTSRNSFFEIQLCVCFCCSKNPLRMSEMGYFNISEYESELLCN